MTATESRPVTGSVGPLAGVLGLAAALGEPVVAGVDPDPEGCVGVVDVVLASTTTVPCMKGWTLQK